MATAKARRSNSCPVLIRLRVLEELKIRNMSVTELANLAQVSRSTVSNMCNYPIQQQFDNQTLAAIAWALNLRDPGILLEFVEKNSLESE